jgi:hypothetical protein
MSFKTPTGSAKKPGSNKGSVRKAKLAAMPRQHVEQIEGCLRNGAYARAFRGLSTMLAGSYKPGRNLYAIIWHWMLLAKVRRDDRCWPSRLTVRHRIRRTHTSATRR